LEISSCQLKKRKLLAPDHFSPQSTAALTRHLLVAVRVKCKSSCSHQWLIEDFQNTE